MHRTPPFTFGIRIALSFCVGVGALVAVRASAQWSEPSDAGLVIPSSGASAGIDSMPLTTGGVNQTKTGSLTVWQGFSALNGLDVTGTVCWNGTNGAACRDGWQEVNAGSYVRLQTGTLRTDDYGFMNVTNLSVATSAYTLQGTAAQPESESDTAIRAGVVGRAARSDAGYSYGVTGSAGTEDEADHYGVYATDGGTSSAFAARFRGNVAFVGLPGESDLVVGRMYDSGGVLLASIQSARGNSVSEVCLNGDCRSSWAVAGTSLWQIDSSSETLWPGATNRSLSIGNGTFTVNLDTTKTPVTATMAVAGDFSARKMVVGTPTSNLISWATCGDGICSTGEDAQSCADDCDTTPPGMVSEVSSRGPDTDGFIELTWMNPPSDFGGTRILITDGIKPASPEDGTPYDVSGIAGFTSTRPNLGPFGQGKVYFWLYAYDLDRHGQPMNFSDPFGYVVDL